LLAILSKKEDGMKKQSSCNGSKNLIKVFSFAEDSEISVLGKIICESFFLGICFGVPKDFFKEEIWRINLQKDVEQRRRQRAHRQRQDRPGLYGMTQT